MIQRFIFLLLCGFCLTAQAESVRLATSEYPPYVGTSLKGMGYIYVIVTKAFEQAGYDPVVEFLPWREAKQLDKHQNDAIFPSYGDKHSDSLICSKPLAAGPIGLYKHKQRVLHHTEKNPRKNQKQALYNLRKYRFGTVSGSDTATAFDDADFLIKIPVDSDLENLRQLKDGKVDLTIGDIFVNEYYIDKNHPEFAELEFLGPSLETRDLFVCFSRSSPNYAAKLAAFNKALDKMEARKELRKIAAEYGY